MPGVTLEERVAELERKVDGLTRRPVGGGGAEPWWERWAGAFKGSPNFETAVRLGAEYRRSQPTAAEEAERADRESPGDHVSA